MLTIHDYKIILIGDSGVGKTSIINYLINHTKLDDFIPTLGTEYTYKEIEVDQTKIRLIIWDTGGQNKFRAIVGLYYRQSIGCICVFDVTNRNTFINVNSWINDYHRTNPTGHILILANKTDQPKYMWQVSSEEINNLEFNYLLTDCIVGTNIDNSFHQLTQKIIQSSNNNNTSQKLISSSSIKHSCNC